MAIRIIRRGVVEDPAEALKFICPPTFSGGPIDPQPATRTLRRNLDVMIDLPLPPVVAARTRALKDNIRMWIIEDPDLPQDQGRTFPSPLIRTVRGDVVNATVGFKLNVHTIHWHGIEPTPLNDGVGHTSFEASSSFVYQFATNTAGTYFYHCHKNTVLHFEMGLYGGLIVDPPNPDPNSPIQAPYTTGGPGFVSANLPGFPGFDPANFVVPYDVEAVWAVDSFDSIWHLLNHDAFMQQCDANDPMAAATFTNDGILNVFRPDVFVISGVVSEPTSPPNVFPEIGARIQDPAVAINARVNQTILIRLLNADYLVHENVLGLDAIAIGADGHPFGVPPFDQYSSPIPIPAGTPFRTTSARRYDLLVRTPILPGTFPFRVRFIDWVSGKVFHIARTVINVLP